jgi:hypothetical protein
MVVFAARRLARQHGRLAACVGDSLQARRPNVGREDDRTVRPQLAPDGCGAGRPSVTAGPPVMATFFSA